MSDPEHPYVGRGGLKLAHALDEFRIDPCGLFAADFGCNVGGFTDCLLKRGAAHVIAVDTGYGMLAWKLRSDTDRVTTLERTNALYADPVTSIVRARAASSVLASLPLRLVVADMGWTRQRHLLDTAVRWLRCHAAESAGGGSQNGASADADSDGRTPAKLVIALV
ncbi:MAG: SAM-dependent methyltransferase, partial [Planctomycetota bacterium]